MRFDATAAIDKGRSEIAGNERLQAFVYLHLHFRSEKRDTVSEGLVLAGLRERVTKTCVQPSHLVVYKRGKRAQLTSGQLADNVTQCNAYMCVYLAGRVQFCHQLRVSYVRRQDPPSFTYTLAPYAPK